MWRPDKASGSPVNAVQVKRTERSVSAPELGPDFGVDYARFTDPSDPARDLELWDKVVEVILHEQKMNITDPEFLVKNGFVILKGHVGDMETRSRVECLVASVPGVKVVMNHLSVNH